MERYQVGELGELSYKDIQLPADTGPGFSGGRWTKPKKNPATSSNRKANQGMNLIKAVIIIIDADINCHYNQRLCLKYQVK